MAPSSATGCTTTAVAPSPDYDDAVINYFRYGHLRHRKGCRNRTPGADWRVMFDGFRLDTIDTPEASLRVRIGGSGAPLLLLHGHPQTHYMWHAVAAELARDFTIVAPDLR